MASKWAVSPRKRQPSVMMACTHPELATVRAAAGNLPCAGNTNDFDIGAISAASEQRIKRAIEQPIGDYGVEARDDDSEFHSSGRKIAFKGHGLAFHRIGPGPEAEAEAGFRFDREYARAPEGVRDRRKAADGGIARLAEYGMSAEPDSAASIDRVERSDFNENVGCRWESTVDKLQIAKRSKERCAAAPSSSHPLPAVKPNAPKKPDSRS